MSKVVRIDATRKQRALAAYSNTGDQVFLFLGFILSIGFAISMFVLAFHYPIALLGLVVPIAVFKINNAAQDAADRIAIPGTNSRDATNIYNRLNSIYRMPAEPLVKKVYEVEDYAMRHCGGLSYKDSNAIAIRKRMDMLMALEEKQKAEIVGPIVNDDSDLTAARMTLGVDT